jgi:hypothetical protein
VNPFPGEFPGAMRYYAWQALESSPVRGPLGSKRELAETRAYLDLLIREVTKRYCAGMPPGQAAADINMGRFSNWTNPSGSCGTPCPFTPWKNTLRNVNAR